MSEEEHTQDESEDGEDLRYFIRIGRIDLDGTKSVERSLSGMNGIGRRTARIIADKADVDPKATFGALPDEEIERVIERVEGFAEDNPDWLTNHRNRFYTGEATHEIGNDLELTRQQDVNRLQMIRSYRGIRHQRGQKVRGQRTRSTGRSEGTVGVNVEAIREEREEEAAGDDE